MSTDLRLAVASGALALVAAAIGEEWDSIFLAFLACCFWHEATKHSLSIRGNTP